MTREDSIDKVVLALSICRLDSRLGESVVTLMNSERAGHSFHILGKIWAIVIT